MQRATSRASRYPRGISAALATDGARARRPASRRRAPRTPRPATASAAARTRTGASPSVQRHEHRDPLGPLRGQHVGVDRARQLGGERLVVEPVRPARIRRSRTRRDRSPRCSALRRTSWSCVPRISWRASSERASHAAVQARRAAALSIATWRAARRIARSSNALSRALCSTSTTQPRPSSTGAIRCRWRTPDVEVRAERRRRADADPVRTLGKLDVAGRRDAMVARVEERGRLAGQLGERGDDAADPGTVEHGLPEAAVGQRRAAQQPVLPVEGVALLARRRGDRARRQQVAGEPPDRRRRPRRGRP